MKTKISANTNKETTIHNIKSHLKKLFGIEKKKKKTMGNSKKYPP